MKFKNKSLLHNAEIDIGNFKFKQLNKRTFNENESCKIEVF